MNQRPLMWKIFDRKDKEDIWPKKLIGHSVIYIEEENKYLCLGGNFNFYDNFIRNIEFNTKILQAVDKDIENFNKYDHEKLKYLNELLTSYNNLKSIEVFSYDSGKFYENKYINS